MRRTNVMDGNLPGTNRIVEVHGANRVAIQKTFDGLTGFRIAGTAVVTI